MLLFHKQDSLDELFSCWLHFTTVVRTEIGKLVWKLSLTVVAIFILPILYSLHVDQGLYWLRMSNVLFYAIFFSSSSRSMSHVLHLSQISIPSMHLSSKWADGDTWLSPQPGLDVLGYFFYFFFWESQSLPSRRLCIHPLQPSLLLQPQLDSWFDNSKRSASAEYTCVLQRILPSFRGPRNISSILLGAHSSIPTSNFAVNSWPWRKWPSELMVRGRGNLHQQYHSVLLNSNSSSCETCELMEAWRTQKSFLLNLSLVCV